VLEQVFDRILDGQDVARAVLVAVVQHGSNGGGLARAGGANHQHQTALLHDDLGKHGWEAKGVEPGNLAEDVAHHDGDAVALPEDVHPEVAHVPPAKGEVHLLESFEALGLLRIHHFVGHALDHRGIHGLLIDGQCVAVDFDVNRGADGNEDVRGLLLGHQRE
jgi:hypothetical protein